MKANKSNSSKIRNNIEDIGTKSSNSKNNEENSKKSIKKVLLMGYNGANNTGSETRLISIIEDVKKLLGSEVIITIPTLNEKNLRRYIKEDSWLKIAPIPSIFFFSIRKLVKTHDLVLLVEGSCYMDTWTSALLWAFLWTTSCASYYKIPCIAYAVDAGDLSTLNKILVKREASKTDLIITRTIYAADKLRRIGVKAPMTHTADCAFTFQTKAEDKNILRKIWEKENLPISKKGYVGLAVIDFNLWPVVIKPWGSRKNLYKWPYYFSRSKTNIQGTYDLAGNWATEADRIIEKHGNNIAIICMEELDEPLAIKIVQKMKHPQKTRIFSSKEFNASQMTEIIRGLDLLVTSRYHAGILSLKANIPQIALGHDPRLKGLYKDLKMDKKYLIDYKSGKNFGMKIWKDLSILIDELIETPDKITSRLYNGYEEQLSRSNENPILLKEFLKENGWKVEN
jgi:polysaccharide pyruvyl transferase WcaK-like protein